MFAAKSQAKRSAWFGYLEVSLLLHVHAFIMGAYVASIHLAKPVISASYTLLEDLPVGPFISLPIDHNRLVPGPHFVDEFTVFLLRMVELCELVTFIIRSHIKRRKSFLSADEEGTLDDRVFRFAVHRSTAKDVFTRGFETSKETAFGKELATGVRKMAEDGHVGWHKRAY